jgi:16S rRNA processing protein RimM
VRGPAPIALPFPSVPLPANPVVIGRITKTVGLKGQVRVFFESGNPDRLNGLQEVMVSKGDACIKLHLASAIPERGWARVKFREINDLDTAESLCNAEIVIGAEQLPTLDDGEFYADSLIGSRAVSVEGEDLGILTEIYPFDHHDIWVVQGDFGELLIPAVESFIERVDSVEHLVVIKKVAGLWGSA